MKYGRETFRALLDFDDSRLESRLVMKDDGIWVRPLEQPVEVIGESEAKALLAHPTGNLDQPALPFPFEVDEFRAFCESAPLFEWETITVRFTNDDESLDVPALERLRSLNPTAAVLVQQYLGNPKNSSDLAPGSSDSAASPLDALAARMYPGGVATLASTAKRPVAGPMTLTTTRGMPSPELVDRAERKRRMTVSPPAVALQRRAGPPNWEHWEAQTHAEAWQVLALSVNCEPVAWDDLPDGDLANPAVAAAFSSEFETRLRVVVEALDGHDPRAQMSLRDFAAWAEHRVGWRLPEQFPRWPAGAVTIQICGRRSTFPSQERYEEFLADQQARWGSGYYTMEEAAQRLADLNPGNDAEALLADLVVLGNSGHIEVKYRRGTGWVSLQSPGHHPRTHCQADSDAVTDAAVEQFCGRWDPPLLWIAKGGQHMELAQPAARQRKDKALEEHAKTVLQALADLGHNPLELPPYRNGTPDQVKQAAKQHCASLRPRPMTTSNFDKAWQHLHREQRIRRKP